MIIFDEFEALSTQNSCQIHHTAHSYIPLVFANSFARSLNAGLVAYRREHTALNFGDRIPRNFILEKRL